MTGLSVQPIVKPDQPPHPTYWWPVCDNFSDILAFGSVLIAGWLSERYVFLFFFFSFNLNKERMEYKAGVIMWKGQNVWNELGIERKTLDYNCDIVEWEIISLILSRINNQIWIRDCHMSLFEWCLQKASHALNKV